MSRTRWIVLCLAGLCAAFAYRRFHSPVAHARYVFRIQPEERCVRATLAIERPDNQPIELFGALDGELLVVSNVRAQTSRGDELEIQPVGSGIFPRFRIGALGAAAEPESILIHYDVETGEYLPPDGHREVRQCGTVGLSGCALSLPNLALIPDLPLSEIRITTELPPGWGAAIPFPTEIQRPTEASWWDGTLVAGPIPVAFEDMGATGRLHRFSGADETSLEAMRRIVLELEGILGRPAERLDIVLAPGEENSPRVELPGLVKPVVVDVRQPDPESLRNFVRTLVPRWMGRSPAEWLRGSDAQDWFAIGLSEYLAETVPEAAWPSGREPLTSLEWTWILEPGLRELRPGNEMDPLSRRLVCVALVRDLARILEAAGDSLAHHLSGFRGRGTPDFRGARCAQVIADFLGSGVEDAGVPLSFEAEWDVSLERTPGRARAALPVERQLEVLFTSDTEGYLEGCGCKMSQSGGVAQRAGFLSERRAKTRDPLLVDLGNFSPAEGGRARLDPLTEEEFQLYLRTMERMGYDAVCVGPGELYSGCEELRSSAATTLPLTGLGIRIDGRSLYPASRVVVKGGVRIGLVAFSEFLERGPMNQAREPNMLGVTFPRELGTLLAEVARLRPTVDVLVVAGRMSPHFLRALCEPANDVDLVLVGGYKGYEPLEEKSRFLNDSAGFIGDTAVAFDRLGFLGIGVLSVLLSSEGPVAVDYRPQAITSSHTVDPEIQAMLDEFSLQLGSRPEIVAQCKPLFSWDSWQQGDYAGTKRCQECHERQAQQWHTTPHATAMETLKAARRDRHPKCVKCHVVGLGTESGYRMDRPDPDLAGVSCEICHGAGGPHSRAPMTDAIRKTPEQRVCLECHDPEHSQNFPERFSSAWSLITH